MFDKAFYRFFFAFVVIIALGFAVLVWAGLQNPEPIDNIAQPK